MRELALRQSTVSGSLSLIGVVVVFVGELFADENLVLLRCALSGTSVIGAVRLIAAFYRTTWESASSPDST
jgi:hypothetical protein